MYTPRSLSGLSAIARSASPREQPLARVAVDDGRELVHDLRLLLRQRARHVDQQAVAHVAAATAAELRRALAAQALHGAVLRARRNADALGRCERGHLDRGAADRLGDRDRHLHLEVVAPALEDRGLGDARDRVEVARGTAARPRLALAGQPHAAAVADARGDVHAIALDLARAPGALTGGTRVPDLRAGAAAERAGLGNREEPLRLGLDPAPVAARAHGRHGARLRPGAMAGRAGRRERDGHRHLRALHRLLERDVDLGLEVAAALGPRRTARAAPTAGAEEIGQDVAEASEAAAAAPGPEATATAAAREAAAEDAAPGVVLLALIGVRQDRVGGLHLLEALLGVLVAVVRVRVILARQLAVGLLDLVVRGLLVDAERLVRVLHRRHQPETTTRAGRRTLPLVR